MCYIYIYTLAHEAPLSMEFSRQEHWSGLPFPSPGDLPNLGIWEMNPGVPHYRQTLYPLSHQGSPYMCMCVYIMECYWVIKKEWNNGICRNLDATRQCYEWSGLEGEGPIWYQIYLESKMWLRWIYLWSRNRLSDMGSRLVVAQGNGRRREGEGAWDWEMWAFMHEADGKLGPTAQHRELCLVFCERA